MADMNEQRRNRINEYVSAVPESSDERQKRISYCKDVDDLRNRIHGRIELGLTVILTMAKDGSLVVFLDKDTEKRRQRVLEYIWAIVPNHNVPIRFS